MSSRPKRFSAWGPAAATLASMATSQRTKAALSPWPAALATASVSAPLVSLRSATMTLAPSARKRMTVARPMPLAPPVTPAPLPASRVISISPSDAPSSSELIVLLRRPAGKPSVSQKRGGPEEVRRFLRDFDRAAAAARDRGHGLHVVGCPSACRHRTVGHVDRARWLRRQSRHDQEELGRIRALPAQDVDAGDLLLPGVILVDAGTHHPAQALPESAS